MDASDTYAPMIAYELRAIRFLLTWLVTHHRGMTRPGLEDAANEATEDAQAAWDNA